MPKLPPTTPKELLRVLVAAGFVVMRTKGSHAILKNKSGLLIVVPVHVGREIPSGTLLAIIRDAGMTKEEFIMRRKRC